MTWEKWDVTTIPMLWVFAASASISCTIFAVPGSSVPVGASNAAKYDSVVANMRSFEIVGAPTAMKPVWSDFHNGLPFARSKLSS